MKLLKFLFPVICLGEGFAQGMSWSQVAQKAPLRRLAQSSQESSLRVSSSSSSTSTSTSMKKMPSGPLPVMRPESISSSSHEISTRDTLDEEPSWAVPESLQKTLWRAAMDGRCAVLRRELEKDASLANFPTNGNKVRLLQWASSNGHYEAVELLLSFGARVNESDVRGQSAVSVAASKGYIGIVKLLRSRGAAFDKRDGEGKSVLHWAVAHADLVALLIDEEPNILTVVDSQGKDALQRAAGGGCADSVRLLLAKGVPVDTQDKEGRTALWWAAGEGHKEVCEALVAGGADINAHDLKKQSVVSWAAHKNREAVVRFLVGKNVNLRSRDSSGKEPLHWAVQHSSLVRIFLESGAHPNALDAKKSSPLTWAAHYGALESVEILLAYGADPALRDMHGKTAATLAAEAGHTAVVKALTETRKVEKNDLIESFCRAAYGGSVPVLAAMLAKGMMVNSHLQDRKTALNWAAGNSQVATVRYLLSQNAEVNLADEKGQTPLSWAAHADCAAVVELLLAHSADPCTKDRMGRAPLHWAQSRKVAKLLLDAGADINASDLEGKTALAWACYEGRAALVTYLLNRGALIDKCDKRGCSPLYWSVGHPSIVDLLVKSYHPDLLCRDEDGLNALHCASALGNVQSARILTTAGMDIEKETIDQRTPLLIAVQRGDEQMVLELLKHKKGSANRVTTPGELNALWNALVRANQIMYELLISCGVDETMPLEGGRTLLHAGAIAGNYRFIRQALKKRTFTIDARCSSKGRTAIHWALRMCKGAKKKEGDQNPVSVTAAIISELVMHGADVTLQNLEGLSAQENLKVMTWALSDDEKKLLLLALRYTSLSASEKNEFHTLFSTMYDRETASANRSGDSRNELLLKILKDDYVPFFNQKTAC